MCTCLYGEVYLLIFVSFMLINSFRIAFLERVYLWENVLVLHVLLLTLRSVFAGGIKSDYADLTFSSFDQVNLISSKR